MCWGVWMVGVGSGWGGGYGGSPTPFPEGIIIFQCVLTKLNLLIKFPVLEKFIDLTLFCTQNPYTILPQMHVLYRTTVEKNHKKAWKCDTDINCLIFAN